MEEFEMKFRDQNSKELIFKNKSKVLPFVTDIVLHENKQYKVTGRVISYELKIAVIYIIINE